VSDLLARRHEGPGVPGSAFEIFVGYRIGLVWANGIRQTMRCSRACIGPGKIGADDVRLTPSPPALASRPQA